MTRARAPARIGVALLFAALTVVMFWPLARGLGTAAPAHQDVYFNLWRLRWIAHALATAPAHLFDGNVFFPERDALAYSDAVPVEGLLAAAFAPLNPIAVHNLLILAPIAVSAVALFALARHLTGSSGAGLVAGTAFAFAPFRFEHVMHLELQWTVWMPLAFLALHRAFETGRWRYGLAAGACTALQTLSCIYYGIFLAALLVPAAALSAIVDRGAALKKTLPPLVAGGAIAAVVVLAYAQPYRRVHAIVGDRPTDEVHEFSARPGNYLAVPAGNRLYGSPGRPGLAERRLFPGAIVTLLAFAGLLLRRPSPRVVIYLVLLVIAFEMSLGFGGFAYPIVARAAGVFRGLRALARLGVFVLMFLSILAAYGYAIATRARRPATRAVICALLVAGMLVEYRTTFAVSEYPASAPAVYRLLARLPRGVVAELPAPLPDALPGNDPMFAYFSTFHWFPLVNGYSGNYPPSYLGRIDRLADFPSDRALRQLETDGVAYVIVHGGRYTADELDVIRMRLSESGMAELGEFDDGRAPARLFERR